MELKKASACEWRELYALMEQSFIYEERRDGEAFREEMKRRDFTVYHIVEEGESVGFVSVWTLSDGLFVEHFALREECRGNGFGGQALDLLCQKHGKVCLEVEFPVEQNQIRRVRFYEKHGFHRNAFSYEQPSYHGGEPLPLIVMSYPAPLKDDSIVKEIHEKVYGIIRRVEDR